MYQSTLLEFLNMGGSEIILILGVVLLLFGGKKLPELARGLGKGIREFKEASDGVKREIHRNINAMDLDKEEEKYDAEKVASATAPVVVADAHEAIVPPIDEVTKDSSIPDSSTPEIPDSSTAESSIPSSSDLGDSVPDTSVPEPEKMVSGLNTGSDVAAAEKDFVAKDIASTEIERKQV